ncbi:MAG: hypothetical protein ACR2NS_04035 [Gemmatimonadaceae bacterium]
MTEDNFEEFLKKAAQGYNAPPARTPREEMWSAIQSKRAAGPRVVYGGGSRLHESAPRRFGSRAWLGAAAAALLLVATGVGIGRWTAGPSTAKRVAVSPAALKPEVVVATGSTGSDIASQSGNESTNNLASSGGSRHPSERARAGVSSSAQVPPRSNLVPRVATTTSPDAGPNSAYRITAIQHLSEAEALLTSFRSRPTADRQMDAQLGAWARRLLSNTRLLLDSPVANDPQRRPLLEDLELVLVQIVQLSPGSTPQDRDLIEKSLQQDHVMTRLRTAIPAGPQRGS